MPQPMAAAPGATNTAGVPVGSVPQDGVLQSAANANTTVPAATTTVGSTATTATAATGLSKPEGSACFATLLKDHIGHLEDETVIVETNFPSEQVTKLRTWKDFRSNFTFTSKYLEDVK